jgi:hypothetical protein
VPDVADRLEDGEQHVVIPLELGSVVRVHRVFDGELMKAKRIGDAGDLVIVRLVQTDPDERIVSSTDLLDGAFVTPTPWHASTFDVHRAINYVG